MVMRKAVGTGSGGEEGGGFGVVGVCWVESVMVGGGGVGEIVWEGGVCLLMILSVIMTVLTAKVTAAAIVVCEGVVIRHTSLAALCVDIRRDGKGERVNSRACRARRRG